MATPTLVTQRDFTSSRFSQFVENLEGVSIPDVLARAETIVQERLGRNLLETTYTEVFEASSQYLFVRNRPITSVTSIKRRSSIYGAWETLPLDRVLVEVGPGYIQCYSAVKGFQVEVTYEAGYASVPEDLKEAIIMQAVLLSYQDLELYGVGDAKEPGITYFVRDIDRILQAHRATATVYH